MPDKKNRPDRPRFIVGGPRSEVIPPGEYQSVVVDWKLEQKYGRRSLVLIHEIAAGENRGVQLRQWLNANYETFSPQTKLYRQYEIVTGEALEEGEELNPDDFKERVYRVRVETKKSQKSGNEHSNVTEILDVVRELGGL